MNQVLESGVATLSVANGIAVLAIDYPPLNVLAYPVRLGLENGLRAAIADPAVKAVIIHCEGRTFFAGADISEFDGELKRPDLNDIFAIIEASAKPVIAAIHGVALGGGLELALACHYRVAVPGAKIGLPEVSLGLLPGAGGTQRLPRLAGVGRALDMIVGGKPLSAVDGAAIGIIDKIVEGDDLLEGTVRYVAGLVERPMPLRRVRDLAPDLNGAAAAQAIADFRKAHARSFRGFKAPGHIVAAIEAAVTMPFDEGLKREEALFQELMASPESLAQRHIFFAERAAAKVPGIAKDVRPVDIRSVAVIGAGTMGRGIATAFLNAGFAVSLVERDRAAVDQGASNIERRIDGLVAKGLLSVTEATKRKAKLSVGTELAQSLETADLIVEAVYENLDLKKSVFAQVDAAAKPGAILASNTSFLDLDAIAGATARPERVVGLHFFAPANIMRLLEVVRGAKTADEVILTAMNLGRKLDKVAVLSGVCDGFIANRAMRTRMAAAETLVLEGPMPWDIDRVMVDYGFPMGPFAMIDLVGVDVIGWDRDNSAGRTVQEVLCDMGRWGQKKAGGYYDYDEKRRATPSPVVEQVIREFAARTGVLQRAHSDAQIVERLLYPIVNESVKILDEGIALRASDIDVAVVTGYGWPMWTGGPLFWADTIGLDRVVGALDDTIGPDAVSPLLRKLAIEGGHFQ